MLEMPDDPDVIVEKFRTLYEFCARLDEVDTTGLPYREMNVTHPCPLREDVPEPSMDRERALANVADREYGYVRIKTVLKEGEDV